MFGTQKVLEEKNTKENNFLIFYFIVKKYKRKSNTIKFSQNFLRLYIAREESNKLNP